MSVFGVPPAKRTRLAPPTTPPPESPTLPRSVFHKHALADAGLSAWYWLVVSVTSNENLLKTNERFLDLSFYILERLGLTKHEGITKETMLTHTYYEVIGDMKVVFWTGKSFRWTSSSRPVIVTIAELLASEDVTQFCDACVEALDMCGAFDVHQAIPGVFKLSVDLTDRNWIKNLNIVRAIRNDVEGVRCFLVLKLKAVDDDENDAWMHTLLFSSYGLDGGVELTALCGPTPREHGDGNTFAVFLDHENGVYATTEWENIESRERYVFFAPESLHGKYVSRFEWYVVEDEFGRTTFELHDTGHKTTGISPVDFKYAQHLWNSLPYPKPSLPEWRAFVEQGRLMPLTKQELESSIQWSTVHDETPNGFYLSSLPSSRRPLNRSARSIARCRFPPPPSSRDMHWDGGSNNIMLRKSLWRQSAHWQAGNYQAYMMFVANPGARVPSRFRGVTHARCNISWGMKPNYLSHVDVAIVGLPTVSVHLDTSECHTVHGFVCMRLKTDAGIDMDVFGALGNLYCPLAPLVSGDVKEFSDSVPITPLFESYDSFLYYGFDTLYHHGRERLSDMVRERKGTTLALEMSKPKLYQMKTMKNDGEIDWWRMKIEIDEIHELNKDGQDVCPDIRIAAQIGTCPSGPEYEECNKVVNEFKALVLEHDEECFRSDRSSGSEVTEQLIGKIAYRGSSGLVEIGVGGGSHGMWSMFNERYMTTKFSKACAYANITGTGSHVNSDWSVIMQLDIRMLGVLGKFLDGDVFENFTYSTPLDRYRTKWYSRCAKDEKRILEHPIRFHVIDTWDSDWAMSSHLKPSFFFSKMPDWLRRDHVVIAKLIAYVDALHDKRDNWGPKDEDYAAALSDCLFEEMKWLPIKGVDSQTCIRQAIVDVRVYNVAYMPIETSVNNRRAITDRTPHFRIWGDDLRAGTVSVDTVEEMFYTHEPSSTASASFVPADVVFALKKKLVDELTQAHISGT